MNGTILIAEDDALQRSLLTKLLAGKLGYKVIETEHGRQAVETLQKKEGAVDLAILDIHMPVMGGYEALELIHQRYPDLPVVMYTGDSQIDNVVKAMKLGAADFVGKPITPEKLGVTLHNALKMTTLTREVHRLQRKESGTLGFSDLIGYEAGLTQAVATGRKAASSDIPVLITGETGAGKELFARAIHGESRRAGKAFVAVNCGAIPENLVESTLFGHEKGAFTGAIAKSIGKFREAEGGTIFLDEVGELPLDAQVKLLRALQQREIEPVGAGKPVPVNVRIISATHRNLGEDVSARNFREDLYFRLNVLPIPLPSLRERTADIMPLVQHFIGRFAGLENLPFKAVSPAAEALLTRHGWPGNVRELQNLIHRAMVLSETDTLETEDFSYLIAHPDILAPDSTDTLACGTGPSLRLQHANGAFKTMEEIEQEAMRAALAHHQDNVTQAARSLGMAKSTFYRKMKT